MKFLAPQVKRVVCQVDYDHALKLLSQMGDLGQDISQVFKFSEFRVFQGEHTLSLRNPELKRWVFVGTARSRVMWNDPGVFTNFKSPAEQILKKVCGQLQVKELRRIGLRVMVLCPTIECAFDQLNAVLLEKLCSKEALSTFRLNGELPSDMAITFDYDVGGRRAHLNIGPLKREEVVQRYEDDSEKAPELSMLIDSDYYAVGRDEPLELHLLGQILTEGYEHAVQLADDTLRIIGGEENA